MTSETIYQQYLQGLLQGNAQQCQQAVFEWNSLDPDLCLLYDRLFRRSLYEVGVQWEHGRISVATEHLATAITERIMTQVYQRIFNMPHIDKSAVISCAANENHQIGARMVADIFEIHGWHSWFQGANSPVQDLLKLIVEKKPDVLSLSLTLSTSQETLFSMMQLIRASFSDLPILIGGQAFSEGDTERFISLGEVTYLSNMSHLETWLLANS